MDSSHQILIPHKNFALRRTGPCGTTGRLRRGINQASIYRVDDMSDPGAGRANLKPAQIYRAGEVPTCGAPVPPLNSPSGMTFEFLMIATAGLPLSQPGSYSIAAVEGPLPGGTVPPIFAWIADHNDGNNPAAGPPGTYFGLGVADCLTSYSFGAQNGGGPFAPPLGISDDPGVLHHWTYRATITNNGTFMGRPRITLRWDLFRDGLLQATLSSNRFADLVYPSPMKMRLGAGAAESGGVVAPWTTFGGLIGNVSLVQSTLDNATVLARALSSLAGNPLTAVPGEQVGLWPLQSDMVDNSGQGLDFSLEVGTQTYAALGNGLQGFSFDTLTSIVATGLLLTCMIEAYQPP